jgi:outer membrane lipoprotein-sorting protein
MIVRSGAMKRAFLCFALAVGLAGCPQASHPISRPYAAPAPEALLAALQARQTAVPGMNARVRATSWLSGERIRATVNMLVQRDGRLRFEAEVSLQGTVATLVTEGGAFAMLDARKNELSRGPACPGNVASLIRIPLAPADVAAILLGDARVPDGAAPAARVDWDASAGTDLLVLPDGAGGALQLQFRGTGADRRLVGANHVDGKGARIWRTAYEDFARAGDEWLPGTIRFAEGEASFDDGVEIKFRDRTIGGTPPAGAFTLAPPPGVAVRDVGCGS